MWRCFEAASSLVPAASSARLRRLPAVVSASAIHAIFSVFPNDLEDGEKIPMHYLFSRMMKMSFHFISL